MPSDKERSWQIHTEGVFDMQSMASISADRKTHNDASRSHKSNSAAFNISLHPILNTYRSEVQKVLHKEENFSSNSRVNILTVLGPRSELAYYTNQDDCQVNAIIDSLKPGTDYPTLMALCIKLETNPRATFHYTPSVSKALISRLFNDYGIHSNFLLDIVGRSSYWSAVSQVRFDPVNGQEIYEFHCQQPRWHQRSWYDKDELAIHRNKPPCSVYMTHSTATNTTVYLVVAPDDGIWFSFIDLVERSTPQGDNRLVTGHELATSPFLIHSMISNIGFEQATLYIAEAQEELMTQLRKVNDYSQSLKLARGQNQRSHDFDSREKLFSITRQLHYVSQLLDTGVGRTRSAVKLSSKLLEAHKQFCHQTGRGLLDTSVSQTEAAIRYIHDAYVYQESWLEQFKARKETAMNFVFNMVTQGDSTINLSTSYRMSRDSSSIHTLTVLAMVFLPGTFTATLFSCVAFRATDSGATEVTDWLLPFVLVASTLTLTVITLWLAYEKIRDWYHVAALKLGQQIRSRRNLKDTHIV